jgi:hypothetical protein
VSSSSGYEEELEMDRLIFRAALRATAKVALTAVVFGCGGTVISAGAEDPGMDAGGGGDPRPDAAGADHETLADVAPPDAAVEGAVAEEASSPIEASSAEAGAVCSAPDPSTLFPETSHLHAKVSESTFACCVDELAPLFGEGGTETSEAGAMDPSVTDCCAATVFYLDRARGDALAPARALAQAKLGFLGEESCCRVLSFPVGVTCTPWGPPVPPAMPGEVEEVA